jgi:hypothetical protein
MVARPKSMNAWKAAAATSPAHVWKSMPPGPGSVPLPTTRMVSSPVGRTGRQCPASMVKETTPVVRKKPVEIVSVICWSVQ